MTLKQFAKVKFFEALDAYRNALKTKQNMLRLSI